MFEKTVTRALSRRGLDGWGPDAHTRPPAPMRLQHADKMHASRDWLFEPKWDGFRVLASVRDGTVRRGAHRRT
jgi:ATP-dependent DNA ligase